MPTTALATCKSAAASLRYINRLARPAACIASTNTRGFATTTPDSSQNQFRTSNKPGLRQSEPPSASSTGLPNKNDARNISAIAQRLPPKDSLRMSHRFREFEVSPLTAFRSHRAALTCRSARPTRLRCHWRSPRTWIDTCGGPS